MSGVLDALFRRGVTSVLVEGGAETLASFLRSGFVDRMERFSSQVAFGEGLPWLGPDPPAVGLELVEDRMVGPDRHETLKVLGPREQ